MLVFLGGASQIILASQTPPHRRRNQEDPQKCPIPKRPMVRSEGQAPGLPRDGRAFMPWCRRYCSSPPLRIACGHNRRVGEAGCPPLSSAD